MNPILEMKNISKSFPGVRALSGVNLQIYPGEVHALLGENGAGKSTLIKIIAGIYHADEGAVYVDNKELDISGVNVSMKAGISVIHQELCLAANMTVADNIFMGREHSSGIGVMNYKMQAKLAQEILDDNGLDIDANEKVGNLTVAQQQMVEVAKALSQNARIIIMDEPTASLSEKEVAALFKTIEWLKKQNVAVVYISHRLDELYAICDKVTILRDGTYINTVMMKDVERMDLIRMMVGRELSELFYKPDVEVGDTVLEVKGMCRGEKVKNVSFSLKKGEIVGFYGLVGAGRTELMRLIFGVDKKDQGQIFVDGKEVSINHVGDAIKNGIALVPESRKEQGGVLIQSVGWNMVLCVLDRLYRKVTVNRTEQKALIDNYIESLRIKVPSAQEKLMNLSGGNQQKVIIGKWLASEPKILILDEPTRGIDVGAKKEIYQLMAGLAKQGIGIIMVSSDMEEIFNMSTRIIIMHEGEMKGECSSDDTQEHVLIKATGGSGHE